MNKQVELIRADVERERHQWKLCHSSEAKYRMEMLDELSEFIDSMQEETATPTQENSTPLSGGGMAVNKEEPTSKVWHDASKEKPKDREAILVNIPDRGFGIDCYYVGNHLDSTGYFYSSIWVKEWDFVSEWAYIEDLIKL